jgi:hypothetical protein
MTKHDLMKDKTDAEIDQYIVLREDTCKRHCIKKDHPDIECDDLACIELYLRLAGRQIAKLTESKNGI